MFTILNREFQSVIGTARKKRQDANTFECSKDAFTDAVKSGVVVLDCFATWCGPCKVIAPQVVKYVSTPHPRRGSRIATRRFETPQTLTFPTRRYSDEYPSVHFIKLDVDEIPDVAQELGIRAMPTFLIFKDGEKVGEVVGANPPALRAAIEKAVKN